jgi:hypothetical protein
MRYLVWTLAIVALSAVALALWIRLAPTDPARWHVDPARTPDPATPNFARLDIVIAAPPDRVAARLAARATADGAVRIAGDDGHATWLSRSRLMGYPDFTSVRLEPAEDGTRVIALARARFGRSDMGVNAARLARWQAAMRNG